MSHTAKYPPISKPTTSLPDSKDGAVAYDETSQKIVAGIDNSWQDISGAGGGSPTQVFYSNGSVDSVDGDIPIQKFTGAELKGFVIGSSCSVIGRQAFNTADMGGGDIVIPPNVKEVQLGALSLLEYPEGAEHRVVLHEGLETIGNNAFGSMSYATGILRIPDSVTSIGQYAFGGFAGQSLVKPTLHIGSGITEIPFGCFYGASFQGNLNIPNTITSIESFAFVASTIFTGDLVIPDSVTFIGFNAFQGCTGFNGTLTIPNSITTIDEGVFQGCSGFTGTLTIPNSVTSILDSAFDGCSSFTSLTLPNSVTSIGSQAFGACSGLTNVDCYVEKSVLDATNSLFGSGVTTIHVRSTDSTWTAGAGQTIGGKTGITVIKDL